MQEKKNKNPNDSLEKLAERLEKELGAEKYFTQYDLRQDKTDVQRAPEILELEAGDDLGLPEVEQLEAPKDLELSKEKEVEQLYKQELNKEKEVDRKKLERQEKRMQKKREREALKQKKILRKFDKKKEKTKVKKIKEKEKRLKLRNDARKAKKELKNKKERKTFKEKMLAIKKEAEERAKLAKSKADKNKVESRKASSTAKATVDKSPRDKKKIINKNKEKKIREKHKFGWYFQQIKSPLFFLVIVEICIYFFSIIQSIEGFLLGIVLPLIIILDIIVFGWLTKKIIRDLRQSKFTAINTVIFLGFFTGLIRAVFIAIWIGEQWTFVNIIIEPIITGLLALVVGFVVGIFVKKRIMN